MTRRMLNVFWRLHFLPANGKSKGTAVSRWTVPGASTVWFWSADTEVARSGVSMIVTSRSTSTLLGLHPMARCLATATKLWQLCIDRFHCHFRSSGGDMFSLPFFIAVALVSACCSAVTELHRSTFLQEQKLFHQNTPLLSYELVENFFLEF